MHFFFSKNLVYTKFYHIIHDFFLIDGGGLKTIEKVIRLCTLLSGGCELNYVKNGLICKTTTKKKINTVHNLITFSIVFTNKNGWGGFQPPPHKFKKRDF